MDYIGIIFLVIAGIYFIKGCKKGFIINLLESLKTIIGFVVAFIFCETVGSYLLEGSIGSSLITTTEETLLGINEIFGTVVTSENQELLGEAWEYLTVPASFKDTLLEAVNGYIATDPGLTIGYYISKAITSYVTVVIGFVLILFVFSIVFWLLLKVFKSLSKNQGILSRFLGGLVGLVRALIFIGIICYLLNIVHAIAPGSGIGEFIDSSVNHELGITKFFIDHNIVSYILDLVLAKM